MNIKKILLTVFCASTLQIQAQSYNFTTSSSTYTNLIGSISLNNGAPWDDPEFVIPIGFNFQYFNTTIAQIYIGDWGYGAELSTEANASGIVPVLTPYGADIIDRAYDFDNENAGTGSLSNISYLLEGTSGSRILKIEWNNVGFHSDIDENDSSTDFTNFQLWLYEGSNTIEMHYGPNNITDIDTDFDGETGTSLALMPAFNVDLDIITEAATVLTGNPTAPTVVSTTTYDANFLNGVIPNGTVYRFTSSSLSVDRFSLSKKIKLYPNPATSYFKLSSEKNSGIEQVSIMSANGRIIKVIHNPKDIIDVSYLNRGVYFVTMKTESREITKKLIKI